MRWGLAAVVAMLLGTPSGMSAFPPPAARFDLVCRDGNPRCDIDTACDGQCLVPFCVTPRATGPPKISLCPTASNPEDVVVIPSGKRAHLGRFFKGRSSLAYSTASIRCLRKRRHCRTPPRTCTATLSNGTPLTTTCRIWLLANPPGFAELDVVFDDAAGTGVVSFYGVPTPGAYSFGEPNYPSAYATSPSLVRAVFTEAAGDTVGADVSGQYGSVAVQLDDIAPSTSVHHAVHGSLRAHLESQPAGFRVLDVVATF